MKNPSNNISEEKSGLHPRNKHRSRYDFETLIDVCPELKSYVSINKFNIETIDFTNPLAIKSLNQALLKQFYNIQHWDIPQNYLCPPIPGRVDYIHYIADVLSSSNGGIIPKGKAVNVLDIGVGANCIYPLLGHQEYGWQFIGSEIDPIAFKVAKQIVESNSLSNYIDIRHQINASFIFKGIIKPTELIDITVCNPPFHSSAAEANAGSQKKWKNLGHKKTEKPVLNFGGQTSELWCKGGEVAFITKMIEESANIKEQCLWFTSLVSKSENLPAIYSVLKKVNAISIKTINMSQGNKISRLVAWTFLSETQHIQWSLKRWKAS
ncbi:MAG: 23S rRNA (adenine(1618)-N(6))-methyltransferase RlmF [Bacteroidetes bacterium]|nr:23S rRNA (adenine(1618)-N(6))-methyltransferase RlmF [Bacteroidota bacterium]